MVSKELFSSNLRKFMARDKMSQVDLASRLNVTKAAVSYWYNGRSVPQVSVVQEMANIFSCSVDDLLNTPVDLVPGTAEERLVHIFRNLSPEGQSYLLQQASIASTMFGEQPEEVSPRKVSGLK
jgi:transcriptional regulator with XRE-family HTH domain